MPIIQGDDISIMVPGRNLVIRTDGESLSFSGRARLRGKDELSLFPALFTLDLWNLPEDDYLRLFRCRNISVSCGEACLVSGVVSDVYRRAMTEGMVTSVSISLGLDLWEATVSLTVPTGSTISETVGQILDESGTGIPLLSYPDQDDVSLRPQSLFGRAAECIETVPSAVSARAMLTPSGLMIVPPGGLPEAVQISDADLTDAVAFAGGSIHGSRQLAVLSASVSGWRPGQTVEVRQGSVSFRGIIVSRSVDADTASGPWKCELMVYMEQ